MMIHRRLALPYFRAVRPRTCAWCRRSLPARPAEELRALTLEAGGAPMELLACPRHVEPTRRFFTFADRARWPLRLGIGLPLVALLAALAAASLGTPRFLAPATEGFRLLIGLTVHVAAAGGWFVAPGERARAAFPVHNFYLLGVRAILWIFRIVGAWWIVAAGRYWLGAAGL